ncbi:hypothetical protein D3C84_710680 [compost metagenome]
MIQRFDQFATIGIFNARCGRDRRFLCGFECGLQRHFVRIEGLQLLSQFFFASCIFLHQCLSAAAAAAQPQTCVDNPLSRRGEGQQGAGLGWGLTAIDDLHKIVVVDDDLEPALANLGIPFFVEQAQKTVRPDLSRRVCQAFRFCNGQSVQQCPQARTGKRAMGVQAGLVIGWQELIGHVG